MTTNNLIIRDLNNVSFAKSSHILWHLTTYGTYDILIKRARGYELLTLQGDHAYIFSLVNKTVSYSYLQQNYNKVQSLKKILYALIKEGIVSKKPKKAPL